MGFFRTLLRVYSYFFHGLFALFLLGIAAVSLTSGGTTFRFHLLPWEGKTLAYWLIGLALIGIFFVVMAMKGTLRSLFFFWSLIVLVLVVRGYFFSGYAFVPGSSQLLDLLATRSLEIQNLRWLEDMGQLAKRQCPELLR